MQEIEITDEILKHAQILWDYHIVGSKLHKCDLILALGSNDIRVAERAAELYHKGYAPYILFSGGLGNLTKGVWNEPEADKFNKIAIEKGVPAKNILIENRSTNTGENIKYSYILLKEKNVTVKSMIIVQKPHMERRAYATFMKQWPGEDVEIMITSPQISFEEYPNKEIPLYKLVHIITGDFERIIDYPKLGFQIEQDVPKDVLESYNFLIEKGFTGHSARN